MSERNIKNSQEHVVVCVDGPDADNQAAAWGAANAFNSKEINLAAVIVSGTAVNNEPNAALGSRDDQLSKRVQEMHTARMAGLFKRAGSKVPVFIGQSVDRTDITTPIPHSAHVSHDDYDIFGDNTGAGRKAIAGNFAHALSLMRSLEGKVHLVCGGPFTEIPFFMEDERIASKLGNLAVQAGVELSERAIYSKIAFNHEVDERASLDTFLHYPGDMFYVPSDITRAPAATFKGAEELIRGGVHSEIGEIFVRHRARAEERHKEEQIRREREGKPFRPYPALSIHDLQAVMALQQSLGREKDIFTFEPIDAARAITNVMRASKLHEANGQRAVITPRLVKTMGYIGANQTASGPIPPRYVVASQNTQLYKRKALQLLRR